MLSSLCQFSLDIIYLVIYILPCACMKLCYCSECVFTFAVIYTSSCILELYCKMADNEIQKIVEQFKMVHHPETGYFKEVWRGERQVTFTQETT